MKRENDQWKITIAKQARKELVKVVRGKHRKKYYEILNVLQNNPYEVSQSFEKLVTSTKDYYSRRLTLKHRVVYQIFPKEKVVRINSVWGHYKKRKN